MRKVSVFICTLLALAPLPAEDQAPSVWRRLARPYTERPQAPVDLSNTPRIRQLMRAGNIYLSLSDAIALALENNLDIELQRNGLRPELDVVGVAQNNALAGSAVSPAADPALIGGYGTALERARASYEAAMQTQTLERATGTILEDNHVDIGQAMQGNARPLTRAVKPI